MLIGRADKHRNAIAWKVLDQDHGGGGDQDLLPDIAHARIYGRTFDDAQQRGIFRRRGRAASSPGSIAAESNSPGIWPEHKNSLNAGQYLSQFRENCPALTCTFFFQFRLRLSSSGPSWPQHPAF